MTWPTPFKPTRSALACGLSPYALGLDGYAAAGRAHRRRRAVLSSARHASARYRQFQAPLCACLIGMDLRDVTVDQDMSKSGVAANAWKVFPYACMRPAPETRMDPGPLAKHIRQIAPARCIACHPEDRVNEQPVIQPAPSQRAKPTGKLTFNPQPLPVRRCSSAQGLSPSTTLNQNFSSNRIH